MYFQKLHEFFAGGGVVGEAVGVGEDAAANHETVDFGVLFMECEGVGAVFDVAVDDELGIGTDFVAEFDDIGDEFVVGWNFAHFFLGAKVDGESGGVFGK